MSLKNIIPYKGTAQGKYVALLLSVLSVPAWKALGTAAQALYPWLLLEFKGSKFNKNGKIRLSARLAAEAMGVSKDTTSRAFRELQKKGFIKAKKGAALGVSGMGTSPEYEITHRKLIENKRKPNEDYKNWEVGKDFKVFKHAVKNVSGQTKSFNEAIARLAENAQNKNPAKPLKLDEKRKVLRPFYYHFRRVLERAGLRT